MMRTEVSAVALTTCLLIGAIGVGWVVIAQRGQPSQGDATSRGVPSSHGAPAARSTGHHPAAEQDQDLLIDTRRQQLAGVRTIRVERGSLAGTIRTVGSIAFDQSRLTDVNLKLGGWIQELHVSTTGQRITRGQPLFTLYSPELLTTQNDFLVALTNRDLSNAASRNGDGQFLDRLVETPRRQLLRWDVAAGEIRSIEETREIKPATLFRSPADGVVFETAIVKGMHVEPGQTLFKLVDLSTVWVEADFHETDARHLRERAPVTVTVDAWPGESFVGNILNVNPQLTTESRTLRARIALKNRDDRLKPGMFANVELQVAGGDGLLVPADAVVDSGSRQIVFVALGGGHFSPRPVSIVRRSDGRVQILSGVREGEEVATGATFFLDSESQLQAALETYESQTTKDPATHEAGNELTIELTMKPDPPKTGDTAINVMVRDAGGRAVTDADVRVVFSMAAMPSMSMPPMREDARLRHLASEVYSGSVAIPASGRWDVAVTVSRPGAQAQMKRMSIIAH